MKLLRGIAIGLFCVLSMAGISQNGFTTYTTNLAITGPVRNQTAFIVDHSGNKWIGFRTLGGNANAGLVKYDNTGWTLYNTLSTPALPSNNITCLAEDAAGNIWIGTYTGLVKFDGLTFTSFNTSAGLISNTVTCVAAIGNQVYIGSNFGLSRFDGSVFTNYTLAGGTLPNDTIGCIKAENSNLLWLGGKNRMVEFNVSGTFATTFVNHLIPNNPGLINCIYSDVQNTKWLGTTNIGILKYTGTAFANAGSLYNTYGSVIPNKVIDIGEGLHNGIVFKHKNGLANTNVFSGLTELAPNGSVFQYFYPVPTYTIGDFIERDGNRILVSQGGANTYMSPKMYYNFGESGYSHPYGSLNVTNFKSLDINNVNAGIGNRSYMHGIIDMSMSCYEVPKSRGKHTTNISGLWIEGKDNSGQLRGGIHRYGQNIAGDFWPGPLDTISITIDTMTSKAYDKIWKVSYTDINTFITAFNSGSVVTTTDMLSWPAHGVGNNSRNLAPFVDVNSDGNYNPYDGDYPKIKGDQALYYIYNDMLSAHGTSLTPMGIEVHAMAYAYGCPAALTGKNELSYTTFYDYKIINRSLNNYNNVYIGLWSEAKSGTEYDDYAGCDVAGNFAYVYDADNVDSVWFATPQVVYGNYPPAQGTIILKGPMADINDGLDNDNDQVTDEVNEDCKMNKLISYFECESAFPTQREYPYTKEQFYKSLQGKWLDSASIMCGMPGPGPGNVPTNWIWPGDPNTGISTDPNNTCGNWIEIMSPCSKNYVISSGPFTLNAGQMQEVEYAFVTSFDSTSTTNSNLLSVAKLKTDIQKINAFYNLQNKPSCIQSGSVGIDEVLNQNDVVLYPNPSKSAITIQSTIESAVKIDYDIVDVLGRTVIQNQSNSNSFTVNVSDLTTGIYFIQLKINNNLVVKKFVKD